MGKPRLSRGTLTELPATVVQPSYNRVGKRNGIVHIGVGAFHRAHQAVYTDDALAIEGGDWLITGISLKSPKVRDQLSPQDGYYTVAVNQHNSTHYRVVGSISQVLYAKESIGRILTLMSKPEVRIITLTITEKGYTHDPVTGELLLDHPDIFHDLNNFDKPVTAIGLITSVLNRRMRQESTGLSVLSCDNLSGNGRMLNKLVLSFAEQVSARLVNWINVNVSFPSSMVDRIVPATRQQDIRDFTISSRILDEGLVVTEPFSQWVIEDDFVSGRPAWDKAGALLVNDVKLYEDAKLRMLNGCHSAVAYLGYQAGYEFVAEVIANHHFECFIRYLMQEEITPTVTTPARFHMKCYQESIIERFKNTSIKHRTSQIAMDGSQKLQQRLINTILDRLNKGKSIDALCLVIASWMRYVMGKDEAGRPYKVQDPLAGRFRKIIADTNGDPEKMARSLMKVNEIFYKQLKYYPEFGERVSYWLKQILEMGTSVTVKKFNQLISMRNFPHIG